MKPIKYALVLLVALMAFSSAVEAKTIGTVRNSSSRSQRKREEERRQKQLRDKRAKEIEAYNKRKEQIAELRKKKKIAANAAEKERADKAKEAILAKEKKGAAAKQVAGEEASLLGEYATMVTEVRMSALQRAKLIALLKKQRGIKQIPVSRDNRAEIARLTKAYNAATGAKKGIIASALKAARKKSAPAAAPAAASGSRADHHKQVMALLTPAQKLKWGGYKLAKDPALQFEGITLNPKQIKRIRAICDAASKDLPDEAGDLSPKGAAKARQSMLRNVRSQIVFEVLTPEQRIAVQSADVKKRAAASAAASAAAAATAADE